MPAIKSAAFCNNKGGSGKTFLLFQLACEAAVKNKGAKILVIDFSLYSDVSTLFMGGTKMAIPTAPPTGLQNTLDNTTPDTRAEGLVRDLVLHGNGAAPPRRSVFGPFFSVLTLQKTPSLPSLEKYMVKPNIVNTAVPDNLYLIASAGMASWGKSTTGQGTTETKDETPVWARSGDDWKPSAKALKAAFDALDGEWIVFVDTDHLAACPLTKLILGAVEDVVIPLSLDKSDFQRLYNDVTGNALFTDVMIPMAKDGSLRAKVRQFVFTKLVAQKNEEVKAQCEWSYSFEIAVVSPLFDFLVITPYGTQFTSELGISSPCTPAKVCSKQMDDIAQSAFEVMMKPKSEDGVPDLKMAFPGKLFAFFFVSFPHESQAWVGKI